jgi:uncharacterized repeat protein (TIGR03943 family)
VTPLNRGLLVVAVGVITLQLTLTNAYLHFLRPSMRPYLLLAGVAFVVLGLAVSIVAWRQRSDPSSSADQHDGHDHAHRSWIAWLLLAPIAIGVLAPSALDAYGTARATPYNQRAYPLQNFDVQKYLRTQTIAGGQPELPLSDYVGAALRHSNARLLEQHDIRILGFVTAPRTVPTKQFVITRYRISCCAADATPIQLYVRVPRALHIPATNHWVVATVHLAPVRPHTAIHVVATALKPTGQPDRPYDYN